MGNRYLVVSDLHLVDVEQHEDGWKSYKEARYHFDEELDQLVDSFVDEAAGGHASLIAAISAASQGRCSFSRIQPPVRASRVRGSSLNGVGPITNRWS